MKIIEDGKVYIKTYVKQLECEKCGSQDIEVNTVNKNDKEGGISTLVYYTNPYFYNYICRKCGHAVVLDEYIVPEREVLMSIQELRDFIKDKL